MKWMHRLPRTRKAPPVGDAAALVRLAGTRFGVLSDVERRLLEAVHEGRELCLSPGAAQAGAGACRIRGCLLRWLCDASDARALVASKGVRLTGGQLDELDLECVTSSFPFVLRQCRIAGHVRLDHARFPFFDLSMCEIGRISAVRASLGSGLILRGVQVREAIDLSGLAVAGNVILSEARLLCCGGIALKILGAQVGGRIAMEGAFRCEGCIQIVRTTIGGTLECGGKVIAGRKSEAMLLDSLRVGGSIIMRNRFRLLGTLRIHECQIGGSLDLQGARLAAREVGLVVYGSSVSSALLLRVNRSDSGEKDARFRSFGALRILRTSIDGHLDFSRASIRSLRSAGVDLSDSRIGNRLLCEDMCLRGELVLDRVTVRNDAMFQGMSIDGCKRAAMRGEKFECAEFSARNARVRSTQALAIWLRSARIGFGMDWSTSQIVGDVNLVDARIGAHLYLMGARIEGALLLNRAGIGTHLNFGGAKIGSTHGPAIDLEGATIGSSVSAGTPNSATECLGEIDASRAAIGGNLDLSSITIRNAAGLALSCVGTAIKGTLDMSGTFVADGAIDLRNATIGTLFDCERGWRRCSRLLLDGLSYASIRPLDSKVRTAWLDKAFESAYVPELDGTAGPADFSWQPYEKLVQVFKLHGREHDARIIAIAKQRCIGRHGLRSGSARLWHGIYGVTMGYGYVPQRAGLVAPVVFVSILFLAFRLGAGELMVPTSKEAAAQWKLPQHGLTPGYPEFDPLAYSIDAFVPILKLQQTDTWRPDDGANCGGGDKTCGVRLHRWLWLYAAFGWIATTLVIAGVTGLVRKD